MTKAKFALVLAFVFLPCCMIGCGGSDEATVMPAAEMSAEEEVAYEEESYGTAADDQSQN